MRRLLFALLLLAFCGCSEGSSDDTIAVTSVTVSQSSANLFVGKTLTLTAQVLPDDATDKTVTWTSSNISVASVANGVVTAVATGSANITATAGGKSAVCAVTVSSEPIEVTAISLSIPTASQVATANYSGRKIQIQVTYTPSNANTGTEITWSGSNDFISIDASGLVTITNSGNQFGSSTIVAKTVNGKGAMANIQFSKLVMCDYASGSVLGAGQAFDIKSGSTRLAVKSQHNEDYATVPDADITWASDKSAVATVTAGTVNFVSDGVANITAKVGSYSCALALNVATISLLGEWKLTSWSSGSEFQNDVYLELKSDNTFILYQNLQASGYTKYTGTYQMNSSTNVISGTYSDGKAWATTYKVAFPTVTTLTMTASNNAADVSTYTKTTIPDNVKSLVATSAVRVSVKTERRFL